MSELNLRNAIGELLVKALNKYKRKTQVGKALGMTSSNINYLIKKHNIVKVNNQYVKNDSRVQ